MEEPTEAAVAAAVREVLLADEGLQAELRQGSLRPKRVRVMVAERLGVETSKMNKEYVLSALEAFEEPVKEEEAPEEPVEDEQPEEEEEDEEESEEEPETPGELPAKVLERVGDVVWVRQVGYPHWPSLVMNPLDVQDSVKRTALRLKGAVRVVAFYAVNKSERFGFPKEDDIEDWEAGLAMNLENSTFKGKKYAKAFPLAVAAARAEFELDKADRGREFKAVDEPRKRAPRKKKRDEEDDFQATKAGDDDDDDDVVEKEPKKAKKDDGKPPLKKRPREKKASAEKKKDKAGADRKRIIQAANQTGVPVWKMLKDGASTDIPRAADDLDAAVSGDDVVDVEKAKAAVVALSPHTTAVVEDLGLLKRVAGTLKVCMKSADADLAQTAKTLRTALKSLHVKTTNPKDDDAAKPTKPSGNKAPAPKPDDAKHPAQKKDDAKPPKRDEPKSPKRDEAKPLAPAKKLPPVSPPRRQQPGSLPPKKKANVDPLAAAFGS